MTNYINFHLNFIVVFFYSFLRKRADMYLDSLCKHLSLSVSDFVSGQEGDCEVGDE